QQRLNALVQLLPVHLPGDVGSNPAPAIDDDRVGQHGGSGARLACLHVVILYPGGGTRVRQHGVVDAVAAGEVRGCRAFVDGDADDLQATVAEIALRLDQHRNLFAAGNADRKSTRLNSSHVSISYAVFCLKKKTKTSTVTKIPQ